jgi:hypothetical protein
MFKRFAPIVLVVAVLLAMTILPASAQGNIPQNGPTQGTIIAYPTTALTGSTTVYSTPVRLTKATTYGGVQAFSAFDVFIAADVVSPQTMTATVQVSADGTNYVDAYQDVPLGTTTSVEVSDSVTHTLTTTGAQALTAVPYALSFTAGTSTKYMAAVPSVGNYMRVKLAHTGNVTPTVTLVTRGF